MYYTLTIIITKDSLLFQRKENFPSIERGRSKRNIGICVIYAKFEKRSVRERWRRQFAEGHNEYI